MKKPNCCITGHRPKDLPWGYNEKEKKCLQFKKYLKHFFINKIKQGIFSFSIGMAQGIDMIAAEILLSLKKKFKSIEIYACIPCLNQEALWDKKSQKRYHQILNNCDKQFIISEKYTKQCMQKRNEFMVDNCDIIIAFYNGKLGGTKNTILYAKTKGVKIEILNPYSF